MKKQFYLFKRILFVPLIPVLVLLFNNSWAQVTVSGGTPAAGSYFTLAAAVSALNGSAATGDINVDVLAAHSETAPSGGIALGSALLNGSLAAGPYTLIIQKNGVGANPVINAYAGGTGTPSSAVQDGIFRLVGADNVTIDGIDLYDGNTTNPALMEYGFGLFKLSASDGCINNTIKNCTVTLSRENNATGGTWTVYGSRGIQVVNTTAAAQTTGLTPGSILGINSNNKFYSNTIQNCNVGISLAGYAAASPFILADRNNDVGGFSVFTGNILRNFGGGTSAANPCIGIYTLGQYDINISYNTLNSNDGSGVNHPNVMQGIFLNTATSASSTVTHNTIMLKCAGTSQAVYAINNASGSTSLGNTVDISYNDIVNLNYPTATSASIYLINNTATPQNLTIHNNNLLNNASTHTSTRYNIYNTAAVPGAISIQNNVIDIGKFDAPVSSSNTIYTIYTSQAATSVVTINNNTLQNLIHNGTTGHTGTTYGIYVTGTAAASMSIQNNNYNNISVKGTGSFYFIYVPGSASFNSEIAGNHITGAWTRTPATAASGTIYLTYCYNSSTSPTAGSSINYHDNNWQNVDNALSASTMYGVFCGGGETCNIYNNTLNNISGGAGTLYLMYGPYYYQKFANCYNNTFTNINYGGTVYGMYFYQYNTQTSNTYNNTWSNITTSGATVYGLYMYYTGGSGVANKTYYIYNNRWTDLTTTHANGVVCGINEYYRYYGGTVNVYNNLIGNLYAPNSSNPTAVNGIRLQPYSPGDNSPLASNYSYNTVYLTGTSSAAGFGSAAFNADNYTAGSTTFRTIYTLNNNIFINKTVATGSGLAVGHRLQNSAYLTSFTGTSNNNIWYMGSGLYFYDGTNSDATFAAYLARVTTRENVSQSEDVDFISTSGSSASFLKPVGFHTFVESYGVNITGITGDYASTIRQGNPGYAGTGTAPDIGAWEINGTQPPVCSGTPNPGSVTGPASVCANSGTTLTVEGGNSADLYMSYQWFYATSAGGPYISLGTFPSQPTGSLSVPTYYKCTLTCTQPGGGTATTAVKSMGIIPQPTVVTDISSALFCGNTPANYTVTASGADNYLWSPSTGLSGGITSATVTLNPAASVIYTVAGTEASTGCTNTATVFANRAPAVQVSAGATPSQVCFGASSILTATAGFQNSYCPSQPSSNIDEEIYNVTVNGSSTPAAYANANGCNTPAPGPGSILKRYSNFTTLAPLATLPVGTPIPFTVEENECDGATFYAFGTAIWIDFNQNGLFTDAGEQVFVEASTATGPRNITGNFTVPATAYNGPTRMRIICAEGYAGASLTPCLSFGYGETEDHTVNISGGIDNSIPVSWSPSTYLNSTSGSPAIASNVTTTVTYTATATSAAGCSASATTTLTGGILGANITASDDTICQQQSSILSAQVTSGAGPFTYAWSTGETTSSISVSPMTTTAYSVAITGSCEGPVTSAPHTITVEPVPVLSVSTGYSVYCYGSPTPVVLTASGDGTAYDWSPSGGLSDTATASVNVSGISNSQVYTVVSTLGNCTSTVSSFVRVPGPLYTAATAYPDAVCLYSVSQLEVLAKTTSNYLASSETPAPVPTPGSGVTTLNNTTPVSVGDFDEGYWQVPLPFRFGLFDEGYNTAYINTDGYVNFTGAPITYTRTAIPSASSPNASAFLAWKDWNMTSAGSIEYFTSGTAPSRIFVVKYVNVPPFSGTGSLNGQIEFYETGDVVIFLATTDASSVKTVGLEAGDGVTFQSFSSRNGIAFTVSTPEMWKFAANGGSLSYSWNPSSAVVYSNTPITETYPLVSLPATFNVQVSDTSGCTSSDTLTIIEGLTMLANILAPNNVCFGLPVTLTTQVLGGGEPYTFTWDDGVNIVDGPGSNQSIIVYPPLGNTTYNVTVTDQCTGIPAIGSKTIHVNPLPTLAVTPAAGGSACGADSLTLVASGSSNSYAWSPSSGLNTTTGNTVKAQPSGMGSTIVYTLTGTDLNGCTNTASVPVKHALPVSVTASALPTDVCSGGNSQLAALATVPNKINLGAAYTNSYYYGPGYFVSSTSNYWSKSAAIYTSNEILAAGGGAGNITKIAYNKANNSTYSGAAVLEIWMKHVNYNTYTATSTPFSTLTSGATLVYSSSAQSLDGTIGWVDFDLQTPFNWNGSDNIQIITALYKPSGTNATPASVLWQYAYTGTSNYWNAYAYSTVQTSTANLSRIYYRPVIQLTFPVGFTYSWNPTTFLSNPAIENPVAQNVTTSTLYTITATSDDGCFANATTNVEVKPLSASASVSSGLVCQDSSVTLTATGDGGGPPYAYTWKEGSTVIGTGSTLTITPNSIGSHMYTVYIDDICGSPTASANILVNEVAKPNVTVTKSGDICGNGSVTLAASGANVYVWSPTSSLSSPASDSTSASPSVTTAYVVYGTSLLTGCTSISDPVTVYVHLLPTVSASATPNPILLNANTQLNAVATQNSNYGYTVSAIPFGGRDLTSVPGIAAGTGDEPNTDMPLGFSFNFFGNNYTGVTFHANGQILMGLGNSTANSIYSPPSTGIPSAAAPNNWCGYWVDQNWSSTSQMEWGVVGSAPNRKLIVRVNGVNYYSSTPSNTYQYELHEGTNYIDVYIVDNATTSTLYRQIGIENSTGTMGISAPGRNYGQWTTNSEGWRFSPVSFGAPMFSYSWTPSTYLDDTSIVNPYATAVGGVTNYTVNVTNTTTGCSALPATVSVLAGVTLNVDATSNDTILCFGESTLLKSFVTGGGIPYSYSWTDGVNVLSTEDSILVNPSVTTEYTLTVTDVGSATVPAYISVVVNPLPSVTVTPPGGSICNSSTGVTMTASGNSNSYAWTPATGLSSTTAATVTANPSITTIYTVTGTILATGCKDKAIQTVHKANLSVNAYGSPYSVCYEQDGQLNNVSSNSLSTYSVSSIPFTDMDNASLSGVGAALGDEGNINVNLGFTFNYFGNNYTAVTIHSNGQILMGSNNTTANSVYSPPTAFPSTANPNNWCGFWADLNVPIAGSITYGVMGSAPNRKLIVRFINVDYWSSSPGVTYQIELNETTNHIDMFITSNATASANSRLLGLENSNGTIGAVAPGRNTGTWTATNEGWRFTPAGAFTYSWTPTTFLNDGTIPNPSITALTDTLVYTLTVTEPISGCQWSDTAKINAVPLPTVELSGSDSVCAGSSTNLTFAFTGLAPFTYSYTDGINTYGPLTSSTNVASVAVVPAGVAGESFTYTPTSIYDSRCTGNETALFGSAKIDLIALSSDAGLSVTSNKPFNNICTGDQITISINGISSTSLGYQATWKWYNGTCGGTPVPNSTGKTFITVSPTINTTYYARAEGYCNNTPCLVMPVVVNTAPPSTTPTFTYSPVLAYPGATDSIKITPVPGATWYRWSAGGNTQVLINGHILPYQSTSPNAEITFISSATQGVGIGNYHLSVFAGNACGRTNTRNLQIRSSVAAPTAITGPDVACAGQTRSYSIPAITGAKSYSWSFASGTGTIAGNGTSTVSVTFSSLPATLCVHGVTPFNTDGPDLCINVTTNIVSPGPISGDTTPCQGTTSIYTIDPVIGAISYEWSITGIAGATISGTTTSGAVVFPNTSFSGTVQVRAYSGCGYSDYSTLALVNGAPAPIGIISGPVTGLCGVTSVNFQIPATGDTIYNWSVPPGATLTAGQGTNSILVSFNASFGGGSISVIASNACGTANGSLNVSGAPGTATITGNTSVCGGDVENYVASAPGATSFSWYVDPLEGTVIPTANLDEILVEWITNGGTVTVTASNSCGTSSPSNLSVGSSCRVAAVAETTGLHASVYPNPSAGHFTLQFNTSGSGSYVLKITDVAGRLIHEESLVAAEGVNYHAMELENVARGIYKLVLENGTGASAVLKLVLEQ